MKSTKQLSLFNQPADKKASLLPTDAVRCQQTPWKMFIDGASRNNPGKAGIGIHIEKDESSIYDHGFFIGIKTNNEAEYLALIVGLIQLESLIKPFDTVEIHSDSQLLTRQMNGMYQIKKTELKKLALAAKKLLAPLRYTIIHVMRENNLLADALANKGIDQNKKLPEHITQRLHHYDIIL
jgi:ribonuclease HI